MKNKNNIFYTLIAIAITLGSCQQTLTDTNVNPNNLESPDVTTLTRNVIVNEFWDNASQAWTLGNAMSQLVVFSQSYYNTNSRYTPYNNSTYWTTCYANARDAATIVTTSKKLNNLANQAVGLALESYAFMQLTDLWGDIPYLHALEGTSGNYLAPYDNQQTVYTAPVNGILARLSTADSLLAANPGVIAIGDPLYNGNVKSWRQFINALRLRALLRISAVYTNAAADIQSIVTEGAIFQNASGSATLKLPSSNPWYFPSFGDRSGDFAYKTLDSILYNFYANTGDKDRLQLFFAVTPNNASATTFNFSNYHGLPELYNASATQQNAASLFAGTFYSASNPTYTVGLASAARIITYSEVQFILAEAALKGYITGGAAQAATYYNQGVLGAYAELGLSSADGAAYVAANPLSSDNATALNQIIMQKWALNLNNGFEGFLEQRRTGIPVFDLTQNANGGLIPKKFLYPTDEEFINATNYRNEVKNYTGGKDNTNQVAWW